MAKVRVLGTYQPKRSPLHTLDVRAKIVFVVLASLAVLLAHSAVMLAVLAAVAAAAFVLAGARPSQLAVFAQPFAVVLAVCLVIGLLVPAASADVALGPLGLSGAGLVRGAAWAVRIALIVLLALIFAATTTYAQAADAFTRLLAPFSALGLNVSAIAPALAAAFFAIPLAVDELNRISAAQRAYGATAGIKDLPRAAACARERMREASAIMVRQGYDGSVAEGRQSPLGIAGVLVMVAALAAVVAAVIV